MKKILITGLVLFYIINIYSQNSISKDKTFTHSVTLKGQHIMAFNGIPVPLGWGTDLEYVVNANTADERTIGTLGGIPLVDIWNDTGGIAVACTSKFQQVFTVRLTYYPDSVVMQAQANNPNDIVIIQHQGDYYEALHTYALMMQNNGISAKPAPDWMFDINWETYGFEENFTIDTIYSMIPVLQQLGIKNITIDAGWYGEGIGANCDFWTGDFYVNPDIIGTEQDFINLIDSLHSLGFKVRIWWVPGVAEQGTDLHDNHPDWFTDSVICSTGETGDYYLNPTNPAVVTWNTNLIQRFLSYGVDGFKQDDIYNYINHDSSYQKAYSALINSNLSIAQSIKPDFAINTCNCGLCQNLFHLNGQNAIITSDPVGSHQFKHRAKYLHALNVDGAAILGDHVELTRGDVSPADMDVPGFYDSVDFASIVPLGMVLQTKFKKHPSALYQKWFNIYNTYKFYKMQWVNIPLILGETETYLMRDSLNNLYFSFFTADSSSYAGNITLSHLTPGLNYSVYDIVNNTSLGSFTASSDVYQYNANFNYCHVIKVSAATGVQEIIDNTGVFNVYPNPSYGNFTIAFLAPVSEKISLKLYDVNGKEIETIAYAFFKKGKHTISFQPKNFPQGVYYLKLQTAYYLKTKKIVVIK